MLVWCSGNSFGTHGFLLPQVDSLSEAIEEQRASILICSHTGLHSQTARRPDVFSLSIVRKNRLRSRNRTILFRAFAMFLFSYNFPIHPESEQILYKSQKLLTLLQTSICFKRSSSISRKVHEVNQQIAEKKIGTK